ncbi:MAG: DNA replication/repair protein RecF [Granulosicoccus sp.]
MIVSQLDIASFRIIENASLQPHPALNLITGNNGTGKSSLLEAIQCLATGHSFRTRKPRELITHHNLDYRVTATFSDPLTEREHRAGLQRGVDGSVDLRLDFEPIKSQSDITRLLPVKALTPDSHKLVQEGPDERRQFLDWGLFHVEPHFLDHWRNFKRALSQRNQLLREIAHDSDIKTWNDPYVVSALELHKARASYVETLSAALKQRLEKMETGFHVELRYRAGWDLKQELDKLLVDNLSTHRKMKTTTDGPHRADIAIYSNNNLAKQVLSRGQQKILVYLLHLAQLDVLQERRSSHAIILCDDLTSELDDIHAKALITQLNELQSQVFVSGVNLDVLSHQGHERFHMEHGDIKKGL